MNMTLKSLVAALLISSPLIAVATDEKTPEQPPAKTQSKPAPAPAQEAAIAEHMKKMQAIHDKIAAAKTPEERQAAMREGMLAMKEGMGMMQNGCAGKGMGPHMRMMDSKMMGMMMQMMDQQAGMMGPQTGMQGMPMQGMPMQTPAEKPAQ
ncbi:hypothetical secreted protein [Pseudomonas knackmussii B13]|uniref:Hypothetical secreted protein n=1 Tax=Pseudomonas knackmussii (strain DSM 6978 / CCUG 54928 / LMG 23759 / B13) TaxID=1301098 RepID=A0A024HJQ2_PSEKB|nr:hypothetical protein [Pseudomonas knackmussii]CDF84658.1 hypothetical secreted protein [Pseudomonas knackmussii B13]